MYFDQFQVCTAPKSCLKYTTDGISSSELRGPNYLLSRSTKRKEKEKGKT